MHHIARLLEIHAQAVQRLRFTECCPATLAAVTLDDAIDVFECSEFIGRTTAASTIHLILSGLALQWF
jgi:hypothetical protein